MKNLISQDTGEGIMKKSVKILSLALAVLMLATVFAVNAFAFSNDYVTVDCPENYDIEVVSDDFADGLYTNLWFDEWYTADDGNEYYTGNNVDLYIQVALEDETLQDYDMGEEYIETLELYISGTMSSGEIKYEKIGGYDALIYEMYYDYEDYESNLRVDKECLYSEVYIITNNCVIDMYIDVVDAKDPVAFRNKTVENFMSSISYNETAILESRAESEKLVTIIGAVVIGILAFIVIVVVVIIIVAVRASKKKKAQRAAQQYSAYNYNPNMQYGQQPPVNNGQYSPYMPQGNTYSPYAPPKAPATETKDPLDLDEK